MNGNLVHKIVENYYSTLPPGYLYNVYLKCKWILYLDLSPVSKICKSAVHVNICKYSKIQKHLNCKRFYRSLPGILEGMAYGWAEGVCWSWELGHNDESRSQGRVARRWLSVGSTGSTERGEGRLQMVFCCTRNKPEGLGLVGDQRKWRRSAGSLSGLLAGVAYHCSP